ncbi:unnamed protein product [Rhodiola kirilowii]
MASKLLVSNLRRQSSALLRRCAAAMDPPIPEPLADEAGVVTMNGVKFYGEPFYLDNPASTPIDSRVLDAMHPYQTHRYGNPHSRTLSDEAVEKSPGQVAELIGETANEIIFTSGATESNNLLVIGVMHFYKEKKKHVITLQTEHKCVGKPLYLDMQATWPVDSRVLNAMLPYYTDYRYGVLDVLNGSAG